MTYGNANEHQTPRFYPGGHYAFRKRKVDLPPDILIEQEFERQRQLQEIMKNIPLGDCDADVQRTGSADVQRTGSADVQRTGSADEEDEKKCPEDEYPEQKY